MNAILECHNKYSADVNNAWSYIFTVPYVFMVKDRDNSTFTLPSLFDLRHIFKEYEPNVWEKKQQLKVQEKKR
jgi:hypothetical protein